MLVSICGTILLALVSLTELLGAGGGEWVGLTFGGVKSGPSVLGAGLCWSPSVGPLCLCLVNLIELLRGLMSTSGRIKGGPSGLGLWWSPSVIQSTLKIWRLSWVCTCALFRADVGQVFWLTLALHSSWEAVRAAEASCVFVGLALKWACKPVWSAGR